MRRDYTVFTTITFVVILLCSSVKAQSPYCLPYYKYSCATGNNHLVSSFQMGEINQVVECTYSNDTNYQFFTQTTDLLQGEDYVVRVSVEDDHTGICLWLDINNDDEFNTSDKLIHLLDCESAGVYYYDTVHIPLDTPVGSHRLRFRSTTTSWYGGIPDACDTLFYGNTGDFTINVLQAPPPVPPGAAINCVPANGSTGVYPTTGLSWSAGTGPVPLAYKVFLGTDNPPTNVLNGTITSNTQINPYPDLAINTTYFWRIVPYNNGGDAIPTPVWSFTTLESVGNVSGLVTDFFGSPIENATVLFSGVSQYSSLSGSDGHYEIQGLLPGTYSASVSAASFNTASIQPIVIQTGMNFSDFSLAQPQLLVAPQVLNIAMNPQEILYTNLNIVNNGTGELNWIADIQFNTTENDWAELQVVSQTIPPFGQTVLPLHLNASGLATNQVYDATVIFSTNPDIGTLEIPLSVTVSGSTLNPVTNVQSVLSDPVNGSVVLSWECIPSAGFLHYTVERDSVLIATLNTATNYTDNLPNQGDYRYCVSAVYAEGNTQLYCIDANWPDPQLTLIPASMSEIIPANSARFTKQIIKNTGHDNLVFEFPEYRENTTAITSFCAASALTQNVIISRVQLANLDQTSGWEGYNDFTSLKAIITKGENYPISITLAGNISPNDFVGVWIDYDQNSEFENDEYLELNGSAGFTGEINVPQDAMAGLTFMRVRLRNDGVVSPCGNSGNGEVEDYRIEIVNNSFITRVEPAWGVIEEGDSLEIHIELSAISNIYNTPGTYFDNLMLNTNDLNHLNFDIPFNIQVVLGGHIQGQINYSWWLQPAPIESVKVTGGSNFTFSNSEGFYDLLVNPGTLDIVYSKPGLQTLSIPELSIIDNSTIVIDTALHSETFPLTCATATVNPGDTTSIVEWCPPNGSYELSWDDSQAETYTSWPLGGNMYAVKFTPENYPLTITGARLFLKSAGMGSSIGSIINLKVFASDNSGMPGQLLDSTSVPYACSGWLEISGLNTVIDSGDFFLVYEQTAPWPDCPELGVDLSNLSGRSYYLDLTNGAIWVSDTAKDYMIHATVMGSENIHHYKFYRLSNFNPQSSPTTGIYTFLSDNFTNTFYIESGMQWNALPPGWYAYMVKAVYFDDWESEGIVSNSIPHKLMSDLRLSVHLNCNNEPAEGAVIKLNGFLFPFDSITVTMPAMGLDTIYNVVEGDYELTVTYPGYEDYTLQFGLYEHTDIDITLEQVLYPVSNLQFAEETFILNWNTPVEEPLNEDFEGDVFPPENWQISSLLTSGWFFTSQGSGSGWIIPDHTNYAVINDELSGNSGLCCEYLITPAIDLIGGHEYYLSFQSYFTGNNGQSATLEFSTDGGLSWTTVYTCIPSDNWSTVTVDLSSFAGLEGQTSAKLAFHYNNNGFPGSGWAIDDIKLVSDELSASSYMVYLNNTLVGTTPGTTNSWAFDPTLFNYGDTCQFCVNAIYCEQPSNFSSACLTHVNTFLYPPLNLVVADVSSSATGKALLSWEPPLINDFLIGYSIFRDSDTIAQVSASELSYADAGIDPGYYCYQVSSIFDLTGYGLPGMTDESVPTNEVCTTIEYGLGLPFNEDFSSGQFDTTLWQTGQNWLIETLSDDPDPAAKFSGTPLLENYSSALESTWINTIGYDSLSPYNIWLDFDYKLEDFLADGNESLLIQVFDSTGWHLVSEISNNGSIDWTNQHINISEYALNRLFKIGFFANGLSSMSISYWAVDDITVFTQTALLPPINLKAEVFNPQGTSIVLDWDAPIDGMSFIQGNPCWETNNVLLPGAAESLSIEEAFDSGNSITTLLGYNIYRREMGNPSDTGFIMIAFTDTNSYIDENLPNFPYYCYQYHITALYDFGESMPSNADSVCFYTGVYIVGICPMKIYPNPASNAVRLEFNQEIEGLTIFNSFGVEMFKQEGLSLTVFENLDISDYPPGVYLVCATDKKGSLHTGRIVKYKL